jgi:hypothetical protein
LVEKTLNSNPDKELELFTLRTSPPSLLAGAVHRIRCRKEREGPAIMDSIATSNLFNTAGAANTQSPAEKNERNRNIGGELGQDQFLKLLVTQLQNQNPLEPQPNAEFVAQLATFSSLEKLTSIEAILKEGLGIGSNDKMP